MDTIHIAEALKCYTGSGTARNVKKHKTSPPIVHDLFSGQSRDFLTRGRIQSKQFDDILQTMVEVFAAIVRHRKTYFDQGSREALQVMLGSDKRIMVIERAQVVNAVSIHHGRQCLGSLFVFFHRPVINTEPSIQISFRKRFRRLSKSKTEAALTCTRIPV